MYRCVIKELSDGIICTSCWFGLLFYDGVDFCDHGAVNIPSIVKQCYKNLLELFSSLSGSEVVSSSGAYGIIFPY